MSYIFFLTKSLMGTLRKMKGNNKIKITPLLFLSHYLS